MHPMRPERDVKSREAILDGLGRAAEVPSHLAAAFDGPYLAAARALAARLDAEKRPFVTPAAGSPQEGSFPAPLQENSSTQYGPFTREAADFLGKIWASPYTLAGAAYGGLGHLYGLSRGTHPKISLGHNAIQFSNNPFVNSNAAFTLGNTILYGDNFPPDKDGAYGDRSVNNGKHEEGHTYQYQALGPLFGPAYMLAGGFSGPQGNPFERAAQNYGASRGSWWPW
jgi:hypothetical protein